jgi:hypothetical protein
MKHSKHRTVLSILAILAFALSAPQLLAATIPAGTTLIVRTQNSISSQDRVGTKFTAQLDQDIAINGTVLLRAGTKVFGRVESSRAGSGTQSRPLTLNLTAISSHGHEVPVVTAQAFDPESSVRKNRRGVAISTSRFVFPHGSRMQFRLAKPLNL